ncbi:PREDICTED: crossover junction endonuclease MUS81 [Nanorana parkeri]|uniref:crossover junction endonuclease MUS81 n=1 Tax=Nanorana parkeri TaxID=125878 RepID=UPI0008542A04|nr:PREDICTED: crossover junction endonuclease MUS81 [Nanorana parkeri]
MMPGPVTFGRKRPLPPCPNPLFLKWLSECRDSAAEKGLKTQFVYQKAISSLKKYPLPLHSGKEAKILQNFGDGICKMLDEKLEKHYAENGANAPIHSLPTSVTTSKNHLRGPSLLPTSTLEPNLPEAHQDPSPTKKKKTDGKKQREYVPQKRSGGYAVLLTLYKDSKNPNSKGYMTKAELQREAQSLCDKSFTLIDPNNKYTAWSSVSTLIQKELVIKTHSPARYCLTEKGLELAQRLKGADQLLEGKSNVVRHFDAHSSDEEPDDANNVGSQENPAIRYVNKSVSAALPQYTTLSLPVEAKQLSLDPVLNSYHHVPDFTLLPGHFNVILCVDFIETTGGSAHKKQELVSELKRNGVDFDVRKLHIGDFLWIAQEKVHPVPGQLRIPQPRELVLDYIIERKRMDDLCGSIIDGRFREQKVVDGFFIKRTKDVRESAAYLTIMTRYLQNMYLNKTLLSCTKEEASKCDRVLRHDAQSCILMEFKEFNEGAMKNKAQTVKEVFARQLMQISGVSGEKAAAILERYNTPASLLSAYENCSYEEKEKLLSSVKCGKLQRNLGPVLSRTIAQLYCTKEALS